MATKKTKKKSIARKYLFDFDRTLSLYQAAANDIPDRPLAKLDMGTPIKPIVDTLRSYVAQGKHCQIFTARVAPHPEIPEFDVNERIKDIHAWLEKHDIPKLEVVHTKDHFTQEIWDDRAIAVQPNEGRIFSWDFSQIPREDIEYILFHLNHELIRQMIRENIMDTLRDE